MKTNTKDLFLEIIKFVDEKDYKTLYFDNINKKINTDVLSLIFQEILIWNHPVFLDLKISHEDKLDINEKGKENFLLLLNNSPLGDIFEINDTFLRFKKNINQEEKQEIRELINKSKKIKLKSKESRKIN